MKHIYILSLLVIFDLVTTVLPAHAQGKAYNKVCYYAKLNNATAQLNYADGYLAASEITLGRGKKAFVFIPDAGVPEANGDFRFSAKKNPMRKPYIVLRNIDDLAGAPQTIHGTYYSDGKAQTVFFKKKN